MERKDALVSVIVPAYNEEETIGNVLNDLMKMSRNGFPVEVVVVDDGSSDGTHKEVAKFPEVVYLRHERNLGKGMALKTGLRVAKGMVCVIQDADSEYSPKEIPRLVTPILKGDADVVYGSRFMGNRNGMSLSHTIGNTVLSKVTSLLFMKNITDVMTGHKAFSRRVIRSFGFQADDFSIETEFTARVLQKRLRVLEIPINYSYRKKGTAKIKYIDGLRSLARLLSVFFSEA